MASPLPQAPPAPARPRWLARPRRRVGLLAGALAWLGAGVPLPALAADFREELDFAPAFSLGPRVLQALGRPLGPGPELTEADEIANPSGWSDSLSVDLPIDASLLTLVPSGPNSFQSLWVRVEALPVALAGVVIEQTTAVDAGQAPSFERRISFTPDSISVDYEVTDLENDFADLDPGGFDRFALNAPTFPSALLAGGSADFRLEMDRPVPDPRGPKVFERLGAGFGVPPELTLADEVSDPEKLDGGLVVDVNPETGQLSIAESSTESPQIVRLALENLSLGAAKRRIVGVVVLSNGLVDPLLSDPTTRTVSFTDDAVYVDYRVDDVAGGDTFGFQAGGVDRFRIVVPEPGPERAALGGALALAGLGALRRRR